MQLQHICRLRNAAVVVQSRTGVIEADYWEELVGAIIFRSLPGVDARNSRTIFYRIPRERTPKVSFPTIRPSAVWVRSSREVVDSVIGGCRAR